MGALCSIRVHSGTVSRTFLHSGAFWRTPAIQAPDSTDRNGTGALWSIRVHSGAVSRTFLHPGAFWRTPASLAPPDLGGREGSPQENHKIIPKTL